MHRFGNPITELYKYSICLTYEKLSNVRINYLHEVSQYDRMIFDHIRETIELRRELFELYN